MVRQAEDHAVAAAHGLEQPGPVQKTAVRHAEAGLVRVEGKELIATARGSALDGLLDEVLGTIRSSKRARSLNHWVGKIGRSGGKIKEKLLARLVEKSILQREEHRLLWVFPTRRYPQIDPGPEYRIRERVRSAIRGMIPPHERTAALISLVHACDLTGTIFEKGERRDAKRRAKEITKSQPIGSAVARAVEAVKAAAIAAAT